jgi:hypothetical protein
MNSGGMQNAESANSSNEDEPDEREPATVDRETGESSSREVVWGGRAVAHLEEARQVLAAVRRLVVSVAWLVAALLLLFAILARVA